MNEKKYTDQDFIEAAKKSPSIRQALILLGLEPKGGNYKVFKRKADILNVDISHYKGQGYLKGKTHNWSVKTPLEEILIKDSLYGGGTYKLKNRLLKENLLERKCYADDCGLVEWKGKPIPLELEHKNGNNIDNRIENLELLCPNCHALTDTYRGKNKVKNK